VVREMPSPPLLLELSSNMGMALFKIQNAERVIKVCLSWLGADPNVTLAGLESHENKLRKQTLGQVLKLFKEHVSFAGDFEIAMTEFLKARNLFVHDFLALPDFNVETDEAVAVGIEFLKKLINQADLLTKVITGLNQMFANRDDTSVPDLREDLTTERFNEVLALMMLRPKT
jgi:hypothetical protein